MTELLRRFLLLFVMNWKIDEKVKIESQFMLLMGRRRRTRR